MKLTFIELPLFTSLVSQITDDHHLNQLQNDLLKNAEKGDLIPRLHGLRKVRMALAGRGARVVPGSSTSTSPSTASSSSSTSTPRLNRRT